MKVLISGSCGFVGNCIARALIDNKPGLELIGLDNFSRPGSQLNVESLRARGVKLLHGDVRCPSDLECIRSLDWIIGGMPDPPALAGRSAGAWSE
ncbi:MAG: hypothetical protein H0W04_01445 [Chthoniobacterales bacterium]|nr:hypothetical protein [Chthoniobacterales bacterium]